MLFQQKAHCRREKGPVGKAVIEGEIIDGLRVRKIKEP